MMKQRRTESYERFFGLFENQGASFLSVVVYNAIPLEWVALARLSRVAVQRADPSLLVNRLYRGTATRFVSNHWNRGETSDTAESGPRSVLSKSGSRAHSERFIRIGCCIN